MNRRELLTSFAAAGGLSVIAENVLAEPTEQDLKSTRETIQASGFAGMSAPGYLDVRSHADYDLMHIPAGREVPERWYFFIDPIGAPVKGECPHCNGSAYELSAKSPLMTNMYRACSFPPPESRVIERLVFLFSPLMDVEDRNNFVSRSYWEFRLADKVVGRAPLAWTPTEGELTDLFEFDGQFPKRIGRNDHVLSPRECVHLAKPVMIHSLQHFMLTIETKPFIAKKDIDLYALLDGQGAFGVQ